MERSHDWMNEAEGDLEHAKSDMEHGYYNWACFSSQQAAEKAVKAVFQKMGAEVSQCAPIRLSSRSLTNPLREI